MHFAGGARMDVVKNQPKESSGDLDVVQLIAEFDKLTSHLSFSEIAKGALRFMSERLHIARASVALLRDDGFGMFDASVEIQGIESGKLIPHPHRLAKPSTSAARSTALISVSGRRRTPSMMCFLATGCFVPTAYRCFPAGIVREP